MTVEQLQTRLNDMLASGKIKPNTNIFVADMEYDRVGNVRSLGVEDVYETGQDLLGIFYQIKR